MRGLSRTFGPTDILGRWVESGRSSQGAVATLVFLYALLLAQQVLLGVLAVEFVVLAAWLTSPTGPLAETPRR